MATYRKLAYTLLLLLTLPGTKIAAFSSRASPEAFQASSRFRCCRRSSCNDKITRSGYESKTEASLLSRNHGVRGAKREEIAEITPVMAVKKDSDQTLGFLVLLTVPLAWGTYVPVVRYLYEIQPPVPGLVFSACYYVLASLTLVTFAWRQSPHLTGEAAKTTTPWPWQGGMELGLYLVLGNALQLFGLKTVPSDRAGFLVQLTTVMVPLVDATLAQDLGSIPPATWLACFIAFLGVTVMGADGGVSQAAGSSPESLWVSLSDIAWSMSDGDLLIMASAFLYTLHVVRLGRYAKLTTPLKLAASKATVEAILNIALVVCLIAFGYNSNQDNNDGLVGFARDAGVEISTFLTSVPGGIDSGSISQSALFSALGAVAWTGWVGCAYTIYAQSFGQQRVSPTDANMVYSAQPLFTALFAWLLLGETMGPLGVVGGVMISLAVYLVVSSQIMSDANLSKPESSSISLNAKDDTNNVLN